MQIIPAIDIKDGHCVRLKQGEMHSATVFSEDPAAMAQHWLEQGAERLHIVDLNGAVAGVPLHPAFVEALAAIRREAETDAACVKSAPHTMPVRRLDDVRAARQLDVAWKPAAA